MITIELSSHRKACVWLNNLPQASYVGDQTLKKDVAPTRPSLKAIHSVAIEVLIPQGARYLYGLVGAELKPTKENKTHIFTVISKKEKQEKYFHSIVNSEHSYIGLPVELANAVTSGLLLAKDQEGFPACDLWVNCAVYDNAGSSESFFMKLGVILFKIMIKDTEDLLVEELEYIFQSSL
jgi:hypothetical protein